MSLHLVVRAETHLYDRT